MIHRGADGIVKKGGITLIELLIVFAIIAILAKIIAPIFNSSRYAAKEARALYDFDAIKAAARQVYFDIKEWPSSGEAGDGLINTNGITNINDWRGPYLLNEWKADPWGNPYVILQTVPNGPQWISSRGPDSNLNTSDDLILLIHP